MTQPSEVEYTNVNRHVLEPLDASHDPHRGESRYEAIQIKERNTESDELLTSDSVTTDNVKFQQQNKDTSLNISNSTKTENLKKSLRVYKILCVFFGLTTFGASASCIYFGVQDKELQNTYNESQNKGLLGIDKKSFNWIKSCSYSQYVKTLPKLNVSVEKLWSCSGGRRNLALWGNIT